MMTWRQIVGLWYGEARIRARRLGHLLPKPQPGRWEKTGHRVRGTMRCRTCHALGAVDSDGGSSQFSGPLFEAHCAMRKPLDIERKQT